MRILAHRGGAAHAPENTFAAFENACSIEADGIETDIRTTRDGVPVLIHDATVDRTTDGVGAIAELTWDHVRTLNAAARFDGRTHPPQQVPRLDKFLDRFAALTPLTLEVKCPRAIDLTVELLRERGLDESDSVEITAFENDWLGDLRQKLPRITMTWLLRTPIDQEALQWARARQIQGVGPRAAMLSADGVNLAREQGIGVRAWGVKTLDQLHHVVACGVDAMTLDCLDWREALGAEPKFVIAHDQTPE